MPVGEAPHRQAGRPINCILPGHPAISTGMAIIKGCACAKVGIPQPGDVQVIIVNQPNGGSAWNSIGIKQPPINQARLHGHGQTHYHSQAAQQCKYRSSSIHVLWHFPQKHKNLLNPLAKKVLPYIHALSLIYIKRA